MNKSQQQYSCKGRKHGKDASPQCVKEKESLLMSQKHQQPTGIVNWQQIELNGSRQVLYSKSKVLLIGSVY